jgi:hypothetical protein
VRLDNNCVLWNGDVSKISGEKILPVRPAPFLDVASIKNTA